MGKRKASAACAAFFAIAAAAGAFEFEAAARLWPAPFSSYDELAGEGFSGEPQRIWGDFDSYYAEADLGLGFLDWLWLRVGGKGGFIAPNSMYLGSEENSLTIGGGIYGFEVGPAFRIALGSDLDIDLGLSFSYTGGVKTFADYAQAGAVVLPGTFGSYAFAMFGPNAFVRGRYRFPRSLPLALSISAYGSPFFENHSAVSGWDPEPKEEFADGYRYGGWAAIEWVLGPFAGVELGWQAERMQYAPGELATHSLGILFSGPFAGLRLRF